MSRATSTTRRTSSGSTARPTSTSEALSSAACTFRNRKPDTVNACLDEILYMPYYQDLTAWTAHVLVALYAMSTFVHIVQALLSKRWFLLGTIVLCGMCETIGWSGRWWSASTALWESEEGGYWQSEVGAYVMQAITLCIGPCFLNLAWYLLFTRLIKLLGTEYCRFTPTVVGITLTGGTIVAMALQGAGAGVAASATKLSDSDMGSHVMLAGLALQLFVMLVYAVLFAEVFWRAGKGRPAKPFRARDTASEAVAGRVHLSEKDNKKVKVSATAAASCFMLIFIRTCYRVAVQASGRASALARKEVLFCLLDGVLVLLGLIVFNFVHPLWFLPREADETDAEDIRNESWFDTTPLDHREMKNSKQQNTGQWKPGKSAQGILGAARRETGSSFEGSDNLEWATENQRNSQMHPLYEGSVYSGKNA